MVLCELEVYGKSVDNHDMIFLLEVVLLEFGLLPSLSLTPRIVFVSCLEFTHSSVFILLEQRWRHRQQHHVCQVAR